MPETSERMPARFLTVDGDPDLIAAIELRAPAAVNAAAVGDLAT